MTELHESNLSSHKSTLEERVAALQAMLEHERKASEEKMVRLREEEEAKLESHKSTLEERVAAMQTTLEHEREAAALRMVRLREEDAAKLSSVQEEHNKTVLALRQAADSKHKHVEELSTSKLEGHVASYEDKIAALQEALVEEKEAAESKRNFLISQHEEQLAVVKNLLEEEREASARALESTDSTRRGSPPDTAKAPWKWS